MFFRTGLLTTVLLGLVVAQPALAEVILPNEVTSATLLRWFDASDVNGDGTNPSNGALVDTWADKSGNNADATASSGAEPTYIASGVNGKGSVSFSTNKFMTFTTATLTGQSSVFAVLNSDQNPATASNVGFFMGHSSSNDKVGLWGSNPAKFFLRVVSSNDNSNQPWTFGTDFGTVYWQRDSSNKVDSSFNGADLIRLFGNASQGGINTWNQLGHTDSTSQWWPGDIAEVIIYDGQLSANDMNVVGYYLEDKYGLDTGYVIPEPATLLVWSLLAGLGIGLSWRRRRA